jgi:hypothetical protein
MRSCSYLRLIPNCLSGEVDIMPRTLAVCAAIFWIMGAACLTGCGNKEDNVSLDSSKTVHPKTPQQIQAIENNPHIPAQVKAMMLGHGGPPQAKGTTSAQKP